MNTKDVPPPYAIEELLQATEAMVPAETKSWIEELVAKRMEDKTASYALTPEFCAFIDSCLALTKNEP